MTKISSLLQKILYTILTLSLLSGLIPHYAEASEHAILYMFWGDGCPHCEKEKTFLIEDLHQRYPKLEMRMFETWKHPEFKQLAQAMRNAYNIERASVPLTIIGEWSIVGFGSPDTTGGQIEEQVQKCFEDDCIDALDKLGPQMIAARIKDEVARQEPVEWELYPASEE